MKNQRGARFLARQRSEARPEDPARTTGIRRDGERSKGVEPFISGNVIRELFFDALSRTSEKIAGGYFE